MRKYLKILMVLILLMSTFMLIGCKSNSTQPPIDNTFPTDYELHNTPGKTFLEHVKDYFNIKEKDVGVKVNLRTVSVTTIENKHTAVVMIFYGVVDPSQPHTVFFIIEWTQEYNPNLMKKEYVAYYAFREYDSVFFVPYYKDY